MGGCRCTFRDCSNNTVNASKMHFFHFPYKDALRCKKWAANSGNLDFLSLPDSKLRNKVVCEVHFVDKCFMNYKKERLIKTAVPTLLPAKNGKIEVFEIDDEEADKIESEPIDNEIDLPSPAVPVVRIKIEPPSLDVNSPPKSQPKILNKMGPTTTSPAIIEPKFNQVEISNLGRKRKTSKESSSETLSIKQKRKPKDEVFQIAERLLSSDSSAYSLNMDIDVSSESDIGAGGAKPSIYRNNCRIIKMKNANNVLIKSEPEPANKLLPTKCVVNTIEGARNVAAYGNKNSLKKIQVLGDTIISTHTIQKPKQIEMVTIEHPKLLFKPETGENAQLQTMAKQIEELKDLLTAKAVTENGQSSAVTASSSALAQPLIVKMDKGPAMTKVQLFNGIRKYLNPSMVALLRMEMFGTTDRAFRPDEKQFSKELLNLNETVYDYMRDEWRFRLPDKKDVKSWLEKQDDEDIWELC